MKTKKNNSVKSLLKHTLEQLQQQEDLVLEISNKHYKKLNYLPALKYYQGQAHAYRQIRQFLDANIKLLDETN